MVVLSPTVIAGQAPTNLLVARFTDALFLGATAADFNATVSWGDGTNSPGVIAADPNVAGQFLVTATKADAYTLATGRSLVVTVKAVGQTVTGTWTTASLFDLQQAELTAASSGGKIYAIGGYLDDDDYTDRVVSYDPATGTTTEVAPMPAPSEDLAAATGPDGTIYAFGGDNDEDRYLASAFAYNPATDTWTTIAPLPAGRQYLGGAAGPDGRIYAIGGYDGDVYTNEVDAYDPATDTWTTVAPLPIGLEGMGVATGLDGKIYVMGGYGSNGYSSAVYAYDTATDTWTQRADMPVALGYLAAATASDGTIYAIGGDTEEDYYLNTVYAYDPANDTWTQAADLPVGSEEIAAATGPDGRVYAIGGFTSDSSVGGFAVLGSTVVPTGTVENSLTVVANVATRVGIVVAGGGVAGQAESVTVTAFDAYGNVATGYTGRIALTSSDPNAALPPTALLTNGVGTFSVILKTAGPATITATDTADSALTATADAILVTPAAASHFAVAGGASGVAGTVQTVTVTALDPFGNVVKGYVGLVSLASDDPNAALPTASAPVNGVATFQVTLKTAGTRSITASDASSPALTGTEGGLVISPAAAASLRVVGTSTGLQLAITVTALDAFGNTATGYAGTVHLAGDPQSAMPGDSPLTDGVGTFVVDYSEPGVKTIAATDTANAGLSGSGTFAVAKATSQAGQVVSSAPQTFYGESVTLTATFSATPVGSSPMTGTVTFYDGDTLLGEVPLMPGGANALRIAAVAATVSGHASLPTTQLAPGEHVIRAVYSGDALYSSATSFTPVSVLVVPATTSTTLNASTTPEGTTLTAVVVVTSPGNPPIDGTITFFDGDTVLGTQPVVNGIATLALPPLSAGAHAFRAVFSGGGVSSASGSTAEVSTDGPRVVGLSRFGFHARPTLLTLNFDGPLDPARAQDPANYRILDARGRQIAIGSVQYDPSTLTVTISPARRLDVHKAYTLTVFADAATGLAGSNGLALDGAGTGQPGTDFTTRITWAALSVPGRSPAVTFVNGQAGAITGRFAAHAHAVVRAGGAFLRSAFRPAVRVHHQVVRTPAIHPARRHGAGH